jgi:hypothetical protein
MPDMRDRSWVQGGVPRHYVARPVIRRVVADEHTHTGVQVLLDYAAYTLLDPLALVVCGDADGD